MAKGKRPATRIWLWALAFCLCFVFSPGKAVAQLSYQVDSAYAITLQGDTHTVATIGSLINYTLTVADLTSTPLAWVQIWPDPAPFEAMAITAGGGPFYTFTYPTGAVTEGVNNGGPTDLAPLRYFAASNATPTPALPYRTAVSHVTLDNVRPFPSGPMTMTVNAAAWTGATVKKNDRLIFSQQSSAFQAAPAPGERAWMNLSAIGGASSYLLGSLNPHVSPSYTIATEGLDGSFLLGYQAEDPYGNTWATTSAIIIPVDTRPPVIYGATATTAGVVRPYQAATVTIQLAEFDADTVTASCTFFSATPIPLTHIGGGLFQVIPDATLRPSPPLAAFTGNTRFDITVTDNAGNITTTTTNIVTIDNILPGWNGAIASLVQLVPPIEPPPLEVGIIKDQILFLASFTSEPTQTINVTVDLSPIGGAVSVPLAAAGAGLYSLNHTIVQGTSEDFPAKQFRITARDANPPNNTVASWTTPPIAVDNVPPVITSLTLDRITGVGTSYLIGDTFKVSAVIQNMGVAEVGGVNVDVSSLSALYPGLTPLVQTGDPTLFESTFTVGSFSFAGTGWDGVQTIRLIASDAQGNLATRSVSTAIPVDNEFPNTLTFGEFYTHLPDPGMPPDVGYVRAGERLDFHIFLGNTTADLNPVTINLGVFGMGNRTMIASSAPGWMTYTVNDVPVGALNRVAQPFYISISDNDGNKATGTVIVPIDNQSPQFGTFTVTNITRPSPGNKILYGDRVRLDLTIGGITSADGTATVDLSRFGYATDTLLQSTAGTDPWNVTFVASFAADQVSYPFIDRGDWRFTARSYDDSGNTGLLDSGFLDVDNEPPTFANPPSVAATYSVVPPLSATHTRALVGDQVTLRVQIAPSAANPPFDGPVVTANLSGLATGWPTAQALTSTDPGTYTYTFTVPDGLCPNGVTLPLTIRDDDGNDLWELVATPPFKIVASITLPIDNVPPHPASFNVRNNDRAGNKMLYGDHVSLFLDIPDLPVSDGSASVDLSRFGYASDTPFTPPLPGTTTWRLDFVATGSNIYPPIENPPTWWAFAARAWDNSSNVTTINSDVWDVDNEPPVLAGLMSDVATYSVNPATHSTILIGDQVTLRVRLASSTLGVYDGQTVTANLSSLATGWPTAQPLTWNAGTYTYTFTVPNGLAPNGATIPLTIRDDDGNILWDTTVPASIAASITLPIDNVGPVLSNFTVTDNTAPLTKILCGDQVTLRINITGMTPADGSASVDLSRFGFSAATPLDPPLPGTTTWRLDFVASTSAGGVDQPDWRFNVQAWDLTGNVASLNSSALDVDNEPPLLAGLPNAAATYSAIPATHSVVIVGDQVTLKVQLASSSGGVYDGQTVTANLSSLVTGWPTAQPLTWNAGTYTYTFTVISGLLPYGASIPITIRDDDGNQLWDNNLQNPITATISIPLDNAAPAITAVAVNNITRGGGTKILYGDRVALSVTVTGMSSVDGTATVDLSRFGYATNTLLAPTGTGSPWTGEFVASYSPVYPVIDQTTWQFTARAQDSSGNVSTLNSGNFDVDNEPPVMVLDPLWTNATFTVSPILDSSHPYVRIGDRVTLVVKLASCTTSATDGVTVRANLSAMNGFGSTWSAAQDLPFVLASAAFVYSFTVATGPINNGVTFPLTVLDDDGNGLWDVVAVPPASIAASITLPLDHLPPQPTGRLAVTFAQIDPSLDPEYSGAGVQTFVNLNRVATYTWPVTDPGRDAGTCTVDLTWVGSGAASLMTWDTVSLTEYDLTHTATSTGVTQSTTAVNYSFWGTMTDKAGNRITTNTATLHRVDCIPPVVNAFSVSFDPPVPATGTIGSILRFDVTVSQNDGMAPSLDLRRIGGGMPVMYSVGGSPTIFNYVVPIRQAEVGFAGFDAEFATFTLIARDAIHSVALASATTGVRVDNVLFDPALHIDVLDLPGLAPAVNPVSLGGMPPTRALRFEITLGATDSANVDPNWGFLDLSMVGSSTSSPMTWNGGASQFWVELNPLVAAATESASYFFRAQIRDLGGNVATITCLSPYVVDCQRPAITVPGISFTALGGNNPDPVVANGGDVITVFASLTSALDATATASLASGPTVLDSGTLLFIPARNRHEASFAIPTDGSWGLLDMATLSFSIVASDDLANLATPTGWIAASFAVDVATPTLASAVLWVGPNVADPAYVDLGSGTLIDLLNASATLANGEFARQAWLDLSAYPGGPAVGGMTIAGSNVSTAGVSLASYSFQDEILNLPVTLHVLDRGGNEVATTAWFNIDTRRPTVASAAFDGLILTVDCQGTEQVLVANSGQWTINGLRTGIATSVTLTTPTLVDPGLFDRTEITLSLAQRRELAQWDATPITLSMANSVATAALIDKAGNWGFPVTNFPITLTSTTWREAPRVTGFAVLVGWATNSVRLQLDFSEPVDSSTLNTAQGILLTAPQAPTSNPIYSSGYALTGSDLPIWPGSQTLLLDLGSQGRQWVAKKLGSGTTPLIFALRPVTPAFVADELGLGLQAIPMNTSPATWRANVSRPGLPSYLFEVVGTPGNEPRLDLGSGVLVLPLSDAALLTTSDFPNATPTITPALGTRVAGFRNRIEFWDSWATPPSSSAVLVFEDLSLATNPLAASSQVSLQLTPADLVRVLAIMSQSVTGDFQLRVQSGAFANWWGQPNQAYLSIGGPGGLLVATPTAVASPTLKACAFSDVPPTLGYPAGGFIFEMEFAPATLTGNVAIPIASTTPTARLVLDDGFDTLVSSGTFAGWSSRLVTGESHPRAIARFFNTSDFPAALARSGGRIEVFGVTDVFGNLSNHIASSAYDLALRSGGGVNGFSSGSARIEVDTQIPALAGITPGSVIPLLLINQGDFRVTFAERMDTTAGWIPTLTLATSTAPATTLTFTFQSWVDPFTARYTNAQNIDASLVNGSWTYSVAGGRDEAGNLFIGDTRTVQIRTNAPPVLGTNIHLLSVQSTVSTATVIDQPFSSNVQPTVATLSFAYSNDPANLPHFLQIRTVGGTLVGSLPISLIGRNGTAAISVTEFDPPPDGSTTFLLSVLDSSANEAIDVRTLVHDRTQPDLSSFQLTGVGTFTGGVYHYSPTAAGADFTAAAVAADGADVLRFTAWRPTLATQTFPSTLTLPSTYQGAFGSGLTPGSYTLSVVDAAGNLHANQAPLTLWVETTPPTVIALEPSTQIGNTPPRQATFTVTFSERMDPTVLPTLSLSSSTPSLQTIDFDFTGWADTANATTAWFVNRNDIGSTYRLGRFTYAVTGGRDLARNPLTSPVGFGVTVLAQGPIPNTFAVQTQQPHLFGLTTLVNQPYSQDVAPGVANINLGFGTAFNLPHRLLVYTGTGENVATFTSPGSPFDYTVTTDPASWAAGTPPGAGVGPLSYQFRVIDGLNNISAVTIGSITVDRNPPDIANFVFNDGGHGIATGGVTYYSPALGIAAISLTTTATDPLRLVVIDQATAATQAATILNPSYTLATGSGMAPGTYTLTFADLAGNMAIGASAARTIQVDSTSPTVTLIVPTGDIGNLATGAGTFDVTFSEPMQPGVTPTAYLATTTPLTTLALTWQSWTSPTTARFTNARTFAGIPQGDYSYVVRDGADYAGNHNVVPGLASFVLTIRSAAPNFTSQLRTEQERITTDTVLINQPFSPFAQPFTGTLRITYNFGPYAWPHSLQVYDPSNLWVSSIPVVITGPNVAEAVVDPLFFGMALPGTQTGPATFVFRIQDNLLNLSATSAPILYDGQEPTIQAWSMTGVANATTTPDVFYYNRVSALGVRVKTSTTDPIRFLMSSAAATPTFALNRSAMVPTSFTRDITVAELAGVADGIYPVTVVDRAGNFASGTPAWRTLVVDGVAPTVATISTIPVEPVPNLAPGSLTVVVTFDSIMNARNATPTFVLSSGTRTIPFSFVSWQSASQAVFVNAGAVTPDLPQGNWLTTVTGKDLANNALAGPFPTVRIQSRGPVVAFFRTESQQVTTASGTEVLVNQPFSLAVGPQAATLTVGLSQAMTAPPANLHFLRGSLTVASSPLVWDAGNLNGTFTWDAANGPATSGSTTYTLRLVDSLGNPSLETGLWVMDASAPIVVTATITGAVPATSAVYFNPSLHTSVTGRFQVTDTTVPRLRVRGPNSTDTYAMAAAGGSIFTGGYTGRYSRDGNLPVTDGVYQFEVVDPAGNVGVLADGSPAVATCVIDTVGPVVATYATLVGGQPRTRFSPFVASLAIVLNTAEPLAETGIMWVQVRDDTGTLIKQVPLSAAGLFLVAWWDGTDSSGALVIDGTYTLVGADLAGNRAATTTTIYASTSPFKVTGAAEITSRTVDLWFNADLDPTSIAGSVITVPGQAITAKAINGSGKLTMSLNPGLVHNASYTITVTPGTIRNVDGASVAAPDNTAVLTADSQGPRLVAVRYDGVAGQKDFLADFDEEVTLPTAQEPSRYRLTRSGTVITIIGAVLQADQKSVLLSASENLQERTAYTISAAGVRDVFQNPSSAAAGTISFEGRDFTPPTLDVAAFSNPGNEFDLMVVVQSNEALSAPPVLTVAQSGATAYNVTMLPGSRTNAYAVGVHLDANYPGNGTLTAQATDQSGNSGTGSTVFTVAVVSPSIRAALTTPDGRFAAVFEAGSMNKNTAVLILPQTLEVATGAVSGRLSLRPRLLSVRAGLREEAKPLADGESVPTPNELEPAGTAYEISFPEGRLTSSYQVAAHLASGSDLTGVGLFRQEDEGTWSLLVGTSPAGLFQTTSVRAGRFALLRDTCAPRLAFQDKTPGERVFTTARPIFTGTVEEAGAGLALETLSASVDDGPLQTCQLVEGGGFRFQPSEALTGGEHSLRIEAADRVGNLGRSANIRFQVKVALSIGEIVTFPNPASRRANFRMSANRPDVAEDLLEIKIYDTAGHLVRSLTGVKPVKEIFGLTDRYLYDIPWDLSNDEGDRVANGLYLARFVLRDPDDPSRKVKRTHKVAVLR